MADGFSVEIDASDLQALLAKCGPELYMEAVRSAFIDTAHTAEGAIKARTPVVTGNLRRSIQSDVSGAGRQPDPEARVSSLESIAKYGWWVETGEKLDGTKMKSRPGGYRMFEEGAAETAAAIPGILGKIVAEIEAKWAA